MKFHAFPMFIHKFINASSLAKTLAYGQKGNGWKIIARDEHIDQDYEITIKPIKREAMMFSDFERSVINDN